MRILVTGGYGFIGSHVARTLAAAGHDVTILDNLHPAAHHRRATRSPGVGDLRDPETVAAALRGIDVVVHHAAMVGLGINLNDLPEYVSNNDLGTAILLAQMASVGIRRLILASSMVVYGEGAYTCPHHGPIRPGPRHQDDLTAGRFDPNCPTCGAQLQSETIDETAQLDPRSIYAATKVAQENLSAAWAHASNGTVVALRYHNVYGPGMPRNTFYSGVAALFRSALERGEAPMVFEDGQQQRDFIHVEDIVAANVAAVHTAAQSRTGFRAYNIASGTPHTVGEMATCLSAAVVGGPQPIVTGAYRAGDVRHIVASTKRAEDELGFRAQVDFGDGIRHFAHAPLRE